MNAINSLELTQTISFLTFLIYLYTGIYIFELQS
jgi:hypothetical protein